MFRDTNAELAAGAKLVLIEKLLTHDKQEATSNMKVELKGEDSTVQVISRSVAQDDSVQIFNPLVIGEAKCHGHVQCDAIIMGNAKVKAIPGIEAADEDAQLIHEAAIGKIAGDQIVKLMTLGLTEEEAEQEIDRHERRKAELEALMAEPDLYSDQERWSATSREYGQVERHLERAFQRWEEAQAAIEAIEKEL